MMDEDEARFMLELTGGKFAPSSFPTYHINFNFKFELKILELIIVNQQGSEILRRETCESIEESTRVAFKIHSDRTTKEIANLFVTETSEAITTILACLPIRVSDEERQTLIDFAVREARRAVRNSMYDGYEAVDLYILVRKEDRQVLDPFDEYWCMLPATDSSVQHLLNKYDADEDSDESCCCICHEELLLSDVQLLSMPCQHVFHADCIRKWLGSSHYCPLCRFQMPTHQPT